MNDVAIRVENLSKQYKIGVRNRHDTLRDLLMGGLKSMFSRNGAAPARNDTFWALRDISLEIKQGEVAGIIGRRPGRPKQALLKSGLPGSSLT